MFERFWFAVSEKKQQQKLTEPTTKSQ